MGRITNISTLIQRLDSVEELRRFIASALDSILTQLNGKLDFGDNVRTFGPVTVTFSNTLPMKINHGLGRTPVGYFLVGLDRVATIYYPNKTNFPWNDTQIFLQSDTAAAVATIMLF